MNILITESQYQHISSEERIQSIKNIFENLSGEDKNIIFEKINLIHSNKLLTEAEWWNTVGDILGFFDPTGAIDLVNGLDYVRQGDYFFGFLSLISVIPFADFLTKPLMGMSKVSKTRKGIDAALKIAKNAKTSEDMLSAQKILRQTAEINPDLTKLMGKSSSWGSKLKQTIDVVPNSIATSGLKKTLNNWIDLFTHASTQKTNVKAIIGNLAKNVKPDPKTAAKLVADLKKLKTATSKGPLSTFQLKDPDFMVKWFWPGFTIRSSRGRHIIGMMRRTKFYAGLLDYMGVANFVGPEELVNTQGADNVDAKLKEFANTPLGKEYYAQDLQSVPDQQSQTGSDKTTTQTPQVSKDPIDAFFDELLTL